MKKNVVLILLICLSMLMRAEAFSHFGVDSVKSDFFRDWYLTRDLVHYLDNYSDYVQFPDYIMEKYQSGKNYIFHYLYKIFQIILI